VIAGLVAVAGEIVAAMVTGAALVAGLVVGVQRSLHRRGAGAPGPGRPADSARPVPGPGRASGPVRPAPSPARLLPPVGALPTAALGSEWLRSTAALAERLGPATRAAIVRRRQETLDELERRDPEGFARWLAAGPPAGSDPARFVRGEAGGDVRGDQAAGTDAA
jgi:hypothetical protein